MMIEATKIRFLTRILLKAFTKKILRLNFFEKLTHERGHTSKVFIQLPKNTPKRFFFSKIFF